MNMMELVLLILVLTSSLAIIARSDTIRMSGANQNTFINSTQLLYQENGNPYKVGTPQFGENLTITANVTDSQDTVIWVNFTLWNPDNIRVINNSNGTFSGITWNSSIYNINQSGTWRYSIQSSDNDTTNSTPYNMTATFIVTDNLFHLPDKIVEVIPINYNLSYSIRLWTDTRQAINFTFNHTFDNNFSVSINQSNYSSINSTQYTTLMLNISSSAVSTTGVHTYFFNITRQAPYDREFTIPINISISDNYGDVEFVSPTDYTYSVCPGIITHSLDVQNNGNYAMTDCLPYLYDSNATTIVSGSTFSIGSGSTATAQINYNYNSGTIETWFAVECTASPAGGIDKTISDPKITFTQASGCGGGGSVGGGTSYMAPPQEIETPIQQPTVTKLVCGNEVCEEGEDPWHCPGDCMPDLFDPKKMFCTPIFDCGNWDTAWFTNLVFFIVLGGMVFMYIKSEKVGRLR